MDKARMMQETLSERYFALWLAAPACSGIEQATSDVMAALEQTSPSEVILAKWQESMEAVASAVAWGDEPARAYHAEKISVYEQVLAALAE